MFASQMRELERQDTVVTYKKTTMDIREKCRERATKFAIEYGFTNVSGSARISNGLTITGSLTVVTGSSIGRAPVSKTGGWGFDSLPACYIAGVLVYRLGRQPVTLQGRVRLSYTP